MRLNNLKANVLKQFVFLTLAILFITCQHRTKSITAMQGDYPTRWAKIDSLEQQAGLPKSALELTEELYKQALTEQNTEERVRAVLYRAKYKVLLEEDGMHEALQLLEQEIASAPQPDQQILQSLTASIYQSYYQNQQYSILQRTDVQADQSTDTRTWSAKQFEQRIFNLYLSSLRQISPNTPFSKYGSLVLVQGENLTGKDVWPNIQDVLEQRALEYFANTSTQLTTNYLTTFRLEDGAALAPVKQFVAHAFSTPDSTALLYQALIIYQTILKRNLAENKTKSLIINDLNRLRFANDQLQADQTEKQEMLLLAYDELLKAHRTSEYAGFIASSYAEAYLQRSGMYSAQDSITHRYKNDVKAAAEILRSTLKNKQHPDAEALCKSLLNGIEEQTLYLSTELPYLSNKVGLCGANYKNVNEAHFRLVSWNEELQKKQNTIEDQAAKWEMLKGLPMLKTWSTKLTDPGDYRNHNTELELPGMEKGKYKILTCASSDFSYQSKTCSATQMDVSDIQIVQYTHFDLVQWIAVNRNSGEPISNAGTKVYAISWDYHQNGGQEVRTLVAEGKTDARGAFEIRSLELGRQLVAEITANGETASSVQAYPQQPPQSYEQAQMFFFTDRVIYRPGQTIYFKGLAMRVSNQKNAEIIPNQSVSVVLRDANYQEVKRVNLTTNAYGTVQGTFMAPTGVLTGSMTIAAEGGNVGISGATAVQVEEYKRPRFEVSMKAPAQEIVVGDQVTVTGTATNYAGNPTDGAKVMYRVVRKTQFPFCGWWRWIPQVPDVVMTTGEAVTNAEGKFDVKFAAGADKTAQRSWQPLFTYEVLADVTDVSGETRSGSTQVAVGYHTVNISSSLTEIAPLDSLRKLEIKTQDLNGNALRAAGTIRVAKLQTPSKRWHQRTWPEPDLWNLSDLDYRTKHKAYAPANEIDPRSRPLAAGIETIPFQTDTTGVVIDLTAKAKLEPGFEYRITITARDSKGRETETAQFVKVIDTANAQKTVSVLGEPWLSKDIAQPNETVRLWLGNGTEAIHWFILTERPKGLSPLQVIKSAVTTASPLDLPITAADYTSIFNHVFWMQNGFVEVAQKQIAVPDRTRDIHISFETFRDKLAPGAQEQWKLRITGKDKDAVAAEMVAAMYDASLDQFMPHQWNQPPSSQSFYPQIFLQHLGGAGNTEMYRNWEEQNSGAYPYPADLNLFNFPIYSYRSRMRNHSAPEVMYATSEISDEAASQKPGRSEKVQDDSAKGGAQPPTPISPQTSSEPKNTGDGIRTNLNETVFFFPQLTTDSKGDVLIQFTMNEALTRWKFLAFAHTKDLKTALVQREVVTQKELMVLPNQPRFMRAGDAFQFSGKVSNLTKNSMQGTATLQLFDAITMREVSSEFGISTQAITYKAEPGQSAPIAFQVKVPESPSTMSLVYRMKAQAGIWSDGEENALVVVQNSMLVTETMPLTVRGGQTKQFDFERLRQISSKSLAQHKYTVEFTSNPAWYAVRALPYLMEYPHECSEQIFSRMYANTIAGTVATRYPAIRRVYDRWKANGALQSNLTKNQELKSALLQETPWVLEAQSEEQQQQQIALLFDLNRMADEQVRAITTLAQRQNGEGAWPWFDGGRSDEFITRYIVTGFRKLQKMEALAAGNEMTMMQKKAIAYLDRKVAEDFTKLKKEAAKNPKLLEDAVPDYSVLYHLYMHSFDPQGTRGVASEAIDFYLNRLPKVWVKQSLYAQGLIALVLNRFGKQTEANIIIASLKERALKTEELGMYWPYEQGYYWYQMPIETQALMVEVMQEVAKDPGMADEIRIWLLKNKQTTHWKTTKETAEAVYAFLIGNDKWVTSTQQVRVEVANTTLKPTELEEGTGYFKQVWNQSEVKRELSNIKVQNPNQSIAWGAAYWQYFEDLDKITAYNTAGLGIKKEVYKMQGDQLLSLSTGNRLKPGDKLKVRVIITADRPYEYVHLKDMRAAGFEPIHVLSGYRWSGSLGYYESTKDLASHFFIDYLPKGTHVFEYPMVVNHRGDFSNGITTIQCMYAPEFGGHSNGIRLSVD